MNKPKTVRRPKNAEWRLSEIDSVDIQEAELKYKHAYKQLFLSNVFLWICVCADAVFTYYVLENFLDSEPIALWVLTASVSAMVFALPHLAGRIAKDPKYEPPKKAALLMIVTLAGVVTVATMMRWAVDFHAPDPNASALSAITSGNLVGDKGYLLPLLLAVMMSGTGLFSFILSWLETNSLYQRLYICNVDLILKRSLYNHFNNIKEEYEKYKPEVIYLDNYELYIKSSEIIMALCRQYKDYIRLKFGQAGMDDTNLAESDNVGIGWTAIPYIENVDTYTAEDK